MNRLERVKNWKIEIHKVDSMLYDNKVYSYIADRSYTHLAVTELATLQRT